MERKAATTGSTNRKIIISISGHQFVTSTDTLSKYPNTRLGRLVADNNVSHFYEGDPDIFKEILKFYWCDDLHCPKNVCFKDFRNHLKFWEVEMEYLSECCAGPYHEEMKLEKQFNFFERRIEQPHPDSPSCCNEFGYNLWCMLTEPGGAHTQWRVASIIWALFYLLITVSSGLIHAVTTWYISRFWTQQALSQAESNTTTPVMNCQIYFDRRESKLHDVYFLIELLFVLFFTLEIITRFLCCPVKKRFIRSMHVPDVLITLFELIAAGYVIGLRYRWKTLSDQEKVEVISPEHCDIAEGVENLIVLLSQFRFFRLLTYATVYR